jgi:hypothetical protein
MILKDDIKKDKKKWDKDNFIERKTEKKLWSVIPNQLNVEG